VAHFNREELLGRELDSLNFRWGWQVFKAGLVAGAHSPLDWYQRLLRSTLRRMTLPAAIMLLALVLGMLAGAGQARLFSIPPELLQVERLQGGSITGLESLSFLNSSGVVTVWLHNLRVILIATLLGVFSFGVLGVIVLMLPLMLIGYFTANVAVAGFSPVMFLGAFVLPHGLLEIPAIILAGAAILGLGGTLAAPAHGRTIGEAWLAALADWVKVMAGLVLPLLLGAALIEVFITPHLAAWLLGG
jgi:uncharacterized membrane protein SpoIIM required for sporulation